MRKTIIFILIAFINFSFLIAEDNASEIKNFLIKDNLIWFIDTLGEKNYEDANNYCNNLKAEGYSDWHLPSLNELRTIFVGCEQVKNPSFCDLEKFWDIALTGACSCKNRSEEKPSCYWEDKFSIKECGKYWTNTKIQKFCGKEYHNVECPPFFIDFVEGSIVTASPLNKYNFLCVREIKKKDKKESK